MRSYFLFFFTLCAGVAANAQNVQLHYDPRHTFYNFGERNYLTSTVEMFKPDRWGSTFFFVDLDYNGEKGIGGAYWEIARDLKFWQPPIAIHLEYNGGLTEGYTFGNAFLFGAACSWDDNSFNKGFSFSFNYKYIQKTIDGQPHSFQITAVWYLHLLKKLFSVTGFADFWREQSSFDTRFIFLAEPQVWVNFNRIKGIADDFNLSLGTEIKLYHNFGSKGFYAIPTLALKWTFN